MTDIDLSTWQTTDLLYALEQQFPSGEIRVGVCPECLEESMTDGPCTYCLFDELESRGFPAFEFAEACRARRDAGIRIAELREAARG